MVRYPIFAALALGAFAFVAPCAINTSQEAPGAPAQAAKPAADDSVVAKVYGDSITEKQVLGAINQMAQRRQLSPEQMRQKNILLFKEAVDTLIGMALLKKEARAEKLTADPARIDATYQGIVKNFASEAEFNKALEAQGMTAVSLREAIEGNLLNQQVLDNVTKNLPAASDEEIQKFYDGNPKFFDRPEQVHAAHILLHLAADATPEKKAEVRKKLEDLRADIESNKISFAEAAARNSDDKSNAARGGDLGFFSRGRMARQFEDAAFSTRPGTLSPVVETHSGCHLIRVLELRPAGKVSLDESKKSIQSYLQNQSRQVTVQKYIDGLRAKTTVEMVMSEEQWKQRHSGS